MNAAAGRVSRRNLATLVLLGLPWLLCATLYVWKLATGSLAWVPVHVRAEDGPSGVPVVRGFLPGEGATGEGELRIGDRLLRVGARDLAGAGSLGFVLATYEQSRLGAPARIVLERDGTPLEAELALRPIAHPWRTLPLVLSMGALAFLGLWRVGSAGNARAFAYAGITYSLHWSLFPGGPRWLTAASLGIALVTSGLNLPLMLRAITRLPQRAGPRSRALRLAPWLFLAAAPATSSWLLGWPLDGETGLRLLMALNGVGLVAAIALLIRGLRRADALGRRQLKWVAWGFYVGLAPLLAGALLSGLDARWLWLYELSVLATVMIPLGFYIAIARYQFGDIDRLISVTASYNLLLIAAVGAGLVLVPRAAQGAAGLLGIEPGLGQVAISLLLAGVIVPANRRLRPEIERVFFAERFALEQGTARLLGELTSAHGAGELFSRAGERLGQLLRPDGCVLYARDGAVLSPVFVQSRAAPTALPVAGPLAVALAECEEPILVGRLARLGGLDRALLETLGPALIVPVRRGATLIAFAALGAKQSGDVYTSTDRTLLGAVADKLASELARFDQAEVLAQTRAMQEALRRFVPGAVAEELVSGRELEATERECSLLFVDIRGYTSYSEGHRAPEIFSTVNVYTRRVSEIIRAHGGSVVEFNGDGMMAVFGAPRALADKERCAVLAGREIVSAVPEIPLDPGENALSVGVGVATGEVFVGSIQAADRYIWTAIGNHVNLAARLQALTRNVDASMVIDAVSWQRAGEAQCGFVHRPETEIRGRSELIEVYALPLAASP